MARFSPGQYQRVSLSPALAIAEMVAPVVLISAATIFANGLLTAAVAVVDRVFALNRERLDILRGPHGEMLDEKLVPPADRERLTQVAAEMPLMIRRIKRVRDGVVIIWIATGLLVLSVAAIAVAIIARSQTFEITALALVIAGVAGVFAGIATVIAPMARSADAVIKEARRTGVLD